MDATTLTFLVIGGVGVALLLVALLVGEIADFGHPDADGPFSLPAIAAFVGGAGFVGAIPAALLPEATPSALRVLISAAIGIVGALPLAWGAVRMSAGLMHMSTDRTLTQTDVLGATGTGVTAIPGSGYGQVRLMLAGQWLTYSARSDAPLAAGTPIFVTETLSATSVEVVSTADRTALDPTTAHEHTDPPRTDQ
jgi:hypothetical protein